MRKIIKNIVKCKNCGDVLESKDVHDFKKCICGRVAIDGGTDYLKRVSKSPDDYIELSIIKNINVK